MSCTNCKDTILNQTPVNIGDSTCFPDCPDTIGCPDVIQANCVAYSGQDDCMPNGENVQDQIDIIRDYICQNNPPVSSGCTVKVSSFDNTCDYLVNKFESANNNLTISEDSSSNSHRLLLTAFDQFVKVNGNDVQAGYLIDKIIPGDVTPVIDTTDPTSPKIKFITQTKTFAVAPESIAVSSGGCANYYGGGSIIIGATPWSISTDTFIDTTDVVVNTGTGVFTVKPGIYNISIVSNLTTAHAGGFGGVYYTNTQLKRIVAGNLDVIARGIVVCSTESAALASAESKGISITTTTTYYVKVFNATSQTLDNNNANINITFQKIG